MNISVLEAKGVTLDIGAQKRGASVGHKYLSFLGVLFVVVPVSIASNSASDGFKAHICLVELGLCVVRRV